MQGWMLMVEPDDDDGLVIKGERGGLTITATVGADGRCHTLVVESSVAAIDSALLKGLSLNTVLRRAARAVPGVALRVERSPRLSDAHLKQVAAAYNRGLRAHPSRPRRSVAEFGKELARKRGVKNPDLAPPSTVGRWIEAAAERGYLPATTQGRKRTLSQPPRNSRGGRTTTRGSRKRSLSPYSESAR